MKKTSTAISRALVQAVRAAPCYSQSVDGNRALTGIWRGYAPEKVDYPFVVFNLVGAPYDDDWSNRTIVATYDVAVFSENSVEADNLDELLGDALDEAQLTIEGMSTLICSRLGDIPGMPDDDEEGKKIYQSGGTYEIWTDQPH